MYTLVRELWGRRLFIEQLPALVAAFVIADVFYKFGSFALECAAFLVTWAVIDALIQGIASVLRPAQRRARSR